MPVSHFTEDLSKSCEDSGSSQNSEVEIDLIPRRPADLHLEPDLPVTLDSHNSVSNYRVTPGHDKEKRANE